MKALLTAILAGMIAATAIPPAANAFSLNSVFGGPADNGKADARSQDRQAQGRHPQKPVLLAQASDVTVEVGQLEEQVRKLTGQVQDLNYQLLQMQEQMRQMQKDNEFRFERLEGGGPQTAAPPAGEDHSRNMTAPAGTGQAPGTDRQAGIGSTLPGVESGAPTAAGGRGAPPQQLGTLTMDDNGRMVGRSVDSPGGNASGGAASASSSPEDIYRTAYNAVLNGNYKAAASGFRDYLDIYPDGPQAADATFWLGESEFSQGEFNKAARTFLGAHKKYPNAEKAPETLLKLGMALAALNNQDTACATYLEVVKRYPNASASVRQKVAREEKRGGC